MKLPAVLGALSTNISASMVPWLVSIMTVGFAMWLRCGIEQRTSAIRRPRGKSAAIHHRAPLAGWADEPDAVADIRDVLARRYRSVVERDRAHGTVGSGARAHIPLELPHLLVGECFR